MSIEIRDEYLLEVFAVLNSVCSEILYSEREAWVFMYVILRPRRIDVHFL